MGEQAKGKDGGTRIHRPDVGAGRLDDLDQERETIFAGGRYTYPDQRTASNQMVESKFGIHAKLSDRQKEAYNQSDIDYRVDHFLPRDIAALYGHWAAQAGHAPLYLMQDDDQR